MAAARDWEEAPAASPRLGRETVRSGPQGPVVDVVGTQQYQEAIWRIVGGQPEGPGARAHWHGEATLEPEPANAHDPHAVRVTIDGETVGYLASDVAARLQPAITALARAGQPVVVPCYARGGFTFRDGTLASVGLTLRLDPHAVLAAAAGVQSEASRPVPSSLL